MKMAAENANVSPARALEMYAGRYWNKINTFGIDVAVDGEYLRMWCQGYNKVDYQLHHYEGDTFAWEVDRNHDLNKCIFPKGYEGFHKVRFLSGLKGMIESLSWGHDGLVPQGEVFVKASGEKS